MKIRKFYSQAGQDRWVVQRVFNYKTGGYFVDIGAFDGVLLSNTFWLEKNLGWSGLCVEADPQTFRILQRNRSCHCINACIGRAGDQVDFVTDLGTFSGSKRGLESEDGPPRQGISMKTLSVDQLLQDAEAPPVIDYLSVDVEGMEDEVMETFPFDRYRFLCATIERPSTSLRSILDGQGYLLVADQPGLDAFYLHPAMLASYKCRIMDESYHNSLPIRKRLGRRLAQFFREGLRSWLRKI